MSSANKTHIPLVFDSNRSKCRSCTLVHLPKINTASGLWTSIAAWNIRVNCQSLHRIRHAIKHSSTPSLKCTRVYTHLKIASSQYPFLEPRRWVSDMKIALTGSSFSSTTLGQPHYRHKENSHKYKQAGSLSCSLNETCADHQSTSRDTLHG